MEPVPHTVRALHHRVQLSEALAIPATLRAQTHAFR